MADLNDANQDKQIEEIISMASEMPQFDVPEALTQRILASVNDEKQAALSKPQLIGMVVVVVGVFSFMTVDSIESAAGIVSWIVGLACVAGFRLFLGNGDSRDKVVRH